MINLEVQEVASLIKKSAHVLVVQADNPDADSLGSALAIESLIGDLGKEVSLYCAADMPSYLRYMPGWDRVSKDLPNGFDIVIIVDASTTTLLDKLKDPQFKGTLTSKPVVVLDHHGIVQDKIEFAAVSIVDEAVSSTGELIYHLAKQAEFPVSVQAGEFLMSAILGDTQGLTNELTSATTYRVMAELTEIGVSRPVLEEARREFSKMPETIFRYKAELIRRTELYENGKVAIVSIPQSELNEYSPLYNPPAIIQFDTLQVVGVEISIVLKMYDNGRITAAIRSNQAAPIAAKLAERFGGGGHPHASGFKIDNGRPFNEVKSECIQFAGELLQTMTEEYT